MMATKLGSLQRELLTKVNERHIKDNWYLDKNGREWRCLHRMEERGWVEQQDMGEGQWRCYWDITPAGRAALGAEPPAQAAEATTDEPLRKLYSDERLFLRKIVDAANKGRPLPRTDDLIDGYYGVFDSFRKDNLVIVNADGDVEPTDLGHRTLAAAYTNEHFAYKYQPPTPAPTPAPDRAALLREERYLLASIEKASLPSIFVGFFDDEIQEDLTTLRQKGFVQYVAQTSSYSITDAGIAALRDGARQS